MEPAIRIERTTCGLQISDNPTSDNLTPQETTDQADLEVDADGAGLSCPGSSLVAEMYLDNSDPLIKSPAEYPPQDIQEEESAAKGENS